MSNTSIRRVPLAKQLMTIQHDVESGVSGKEDVKSLAVSCGSTRLAERLTAYAYTDNTDDLSITAGEAFKAVVYQQNIISDAPVMYNGEIVPSPHLQDVDGVMAIYSRPLLFPELLSMFWQDTPVERYEIDGVSMERVRHSPLNLKWHDRDYQLLCEGYNKSFYWPATVPLPSEIEPWLTTLPQDRTTLAVGLKRQGIMLESLNGLSLLKEEIYTDSVFDLGVAVMSDDTFRRIKDEFGIGVQALQATIWFEDGSFFKGTVQSESLAKQPVGWYGGLKRPWGVNGATISSRASVMDAYEQVPWSATINRQITDYAGMTLPTHARLPSPETFIKASTGFPAYIKQLNEELVSNAGRVFRKCDVNGFAGKVGVSTTDKGVQFIIRSAKVRNEIAEMVLLFSPALPIHTNIKKVRVEFIHDPGIEHHLILLNVGETNMAWVERFWIQWAGRDNDGDGITLSASKELLAQAVHWTKIRWEDTTQFKSLPDEPLTSGGEAIRLATERIRLFSNRIGIYDKLARRIIRQDASLMTWELRLVLTEAIQRSISAQKKNSGADKFNGYSWLLAKLPKGSEAWLFENIHDTIDSISAHLKTVLSKGISDTALREEKEYIQAQDALSRVSTMLPRHYESAQSLLSLVMEPSNVDYHKMKLRGRSVWATCQARQSKETIRDLFAFIAHSKKLWRSVHLNKNKDNPGFNYNSVVRVIRGWAIALNKRVDTRLLLSGMLNEFSQALIAKVFDVDDLKIMGLVEHVSIPIASTRELKTGMLLKKSQVASIIAHPRFLDALDDNKVYRIISIADFKGIDWLTRTSKIQKSSRLMLVLKEVRSC
jgi:hypothetical protein